MYVSMREMLSHADQHNYAVMAVNCVNMEQVKAVTDAAEEENSAVIINISPRQMKAHGYGDILAPMIKNIAQMKKVPIAFNLDHGVVYEDIAAAIRYGFSSVMIDASACPLEENIRRTAVVADLAHGMQLSCEAELGHVGLANQKDYKKEDLFTNPQDARNFVEATHCDCLAVAIGTAHGSYPEGYVPQLDFERLRLLKETLHVPLALHGGSGSGMENIRRAVAGGINKVNVCTDLMIHARQATAAALLANPHIDYMDLCIAAEIAMKGFVKQYMREIGSANRYVFEE